MALAIAIDLGTANTHISVYRDGHVETILDEGRPSIPSYAAFTDRQRLVGAAAKNQASINPMNTIFDVMRLVDRQFTDQQLQADLRRFPFRVICDSRNKPFIRVEYKHDTKELTPEEVISMVLSRAKESAERYLEQIVTKAVLIVPTRCSVGLRESLKDAALISGLNVLYMINGPTAVVSDYAVNNGHLQREGNILAIDIGARTTDVGLITVEEGILEVKSVASDDDLGGNDFDNRLVNYFVNLFKRQHGKDLTSNIRYMQRLRTTCEGIKCELSSRAQIECTIDSIYKCIDLVSLLAREKFEELCQDLFRSVIHPIERVLVDAKVDKRQIHAMIVVGGSSHSQNPANHFDVLQWERRQQVT
jgi:L1 cell adhesion molecule like protein